MVHYDSKAKRQQIFFFKAGHPRKWYGTLITLMYLNLHIQSWVPGRHSRPPLICSFALWGFSYPWSFRCQKQMIFLPLWSEAHQEPNTISQCLCNSPDFISSHRQFITSYHHKKGEYSKLIYFKKDHIHIPFITVHCYNCSILLLLLISYYAWFISFIMGMCV